MGWDFRTRPPKRDIDVIAEPSSKGDMPSAPELCYVAREVWVVEVAHQFNAKEFGCSDSNIRIAGEIAVNLEGKEDGC